MGSRGLQRMLYCEVFHTVQLVELTFMPFVEDLTSFNSELVDLRQYESYGTGCWNLNAAPTLANSRCLSEQLQLVIDRRV